MREQSESSYIYIALSYGFIDSMIFRLNPVNPWISETVFWYMYCSVLWVHIKSHKSSNLRDRCRYYLSLSVLYMHLLYMDVQVATRPSLLLNLLIRISSVTIRPSLIIQSPYMYILCCLKAFPYNQSPICRYTCDL